MSQLPVKLGLIFLIGARGSGKSTVGKLLARDLALPFLDLDEMLCGQEQKTVAQIVASHGWPEFRRLESQYLQKAAGNCAAGGVIATGGGIVLAAENRKFMREKGHVIWLNAEAPILRERLRQNLLPGQRPSLTGQDPLEEICQIAREREGLYRSCAHTVADGSENAQTVCASLRKWLSAGGKS